LRPDPEAVRPHVAARFVSRAAYAVARHALNPYRDASVEEIARGLWATDMVTPLVLRAASSPATTTTSTWAGSLASSAVGDFISSLVPFSAAARLFNVAPRVSLDGVNSITFPRRSGPIDPAAVPWIAQGAPIPVTQLILTSVQVGPACKLCIAVSMTRETAEHGSGEAVLTTLLRENAALALDASLFSNAAATADRPAGLLNGISALTAAPNGDDAAMAADLSALANAISDDGVGLAFVAHPGQAHTMRLRRGTTFPADIPIWSTLGVAEGVVIALDPQAVVSAFGAEPEVSASKEALIHQETSPAQIGVAGSPNVVAAPTRSLFQTDCVAIRLILRAAWALRAPGAIAHAR
jgi:hypothetical protein